MNLNNCLDIANNMAARAKPFVLEYKGKTYTAVFDQREWVYKVYEDGFFMLNINMKSKNKAKDFLIHYLSN